MADATMPRGVESVRRMPSKADADAAIVGFQALSAEIRGAAILDRAGRLLAASGDPERWSAAAAELLAAADAAAGGTASQAHVATEEGEVYGVRFAGLAMVAVSDRFTLSSLILSDMRSALRALIAGDPSVGRGD